VLEIFATTAPIFCLIILGYVAVKTRLMPTDALPGLGRFVMYFTLPALIFDTLVHMDFADVIEPRFLLAYGIGSLLSFSIGLLIAKKLLNNNLTGSGIKALGMSMSNSAFFGLPVLILVFDDPPTVAFTMALIIENMLLFPVALMTIEYANGKGENQSLLQIWKSVIKRVTRNPLIIAIVAGFIGSALQIRFPAPVNESLHMLSAASATTALFVIGGSLVGSTIKGNMVEISTVIVGKLLMHPLCVALAVLCIPGLSPELRLAAILLAAMPMMSIYPIIGGNYGYRSICASILMGATMVSFISIAAILGILL
jgi:predicted permease